ncbi:MAG: acyl-CoA dehydrogenase family protein [Actinomycetota bacterium]|nr:acyl-CoA dehydrogenase family protein [Actinomycetota bacterium]
MLKRPQHEKDSGTVINMTAQPGLDGFEQAAVAFLDAHARRKADRPATWGEGSDRVGLFEEKTREQERAELEEAQAWRRQVFDAGFGWLTGPARYGGRELPSAYERRWHEVEARYVLPPGTVFAIGLGMVAPTILAHGTERAKERYLRGLYRGDVVGCQLFSEPGAGSDLASLQTKAERDGDVWVINGQKVWTSGAQYSDIGEIICRTDPNVAKHKGLTGFLVDMRAPGVEVRPLRQMTGGASFNEVFFTDVVVPDDHRLGDVNGGWGVALTTLMNERAAIGGGAAGGASFGMGQLIELLRHLGLDHDVRLRQQLADLWINVHVARFTNLRAMAKLQAGQIPGPELSIAKLSLTNNLQLISRFLTSALGLRLIADTGEWGTYAWAELVLGVPGFRVAGGTDEVLRNIIGERVLGLPKEPRAEARVSP